MPGRWTIRIGMGCLAGALSGCVMKSDCVCDLMAKAYSVHVRDAAGPVDSAQVRIYRVSDGADLTATLGDGDSFRMPGTAVIFTDAITSKIPRGGSMVVRAKVTKGAESGEALYTVATDDCRCHFEKTAGPDTLVIR